MKKRGQVTIYVILGVMIVAAVAGVFVLKDYVLKSQFERDAGKFKITDDFAPIYDSYADCVGEIANDGISILSSQGGYIDIPHYEYVPNQLVPFSNQLDFFSDGSLYVAYWFYETSNGIQTEKIPTLSQMQDELGNYVNENIYSCTSNFTGYDEYSINDFNNFRTSVQIEDSKAFVNVKSDFNVDYKDVNQKFDDLKVVVDTSLCYLYSKAVELYNKEKQENYFEEKTIDYLVVYDNIPYSGESFSCSPRVWNKQNIENDFKGILETNTDAVGKVDGEYYRIDLGDDNLGTNFIYSKRWPFFMEINGGDEILKEEPVFGENSNAAKFLTALFCLNSHHFIYDIKYPIMATLSKNGLDFQFAFEVIIDNNQPKENNLGSSGLPQTSDNVCGAKNTLFNFYAVDYETEELLGDADVKFSCVGTSCGLGKTSLDDFRKYSLKDYVPSCVNADIKAYKEGYNYGTLTIDTNNEGNGFIFMKPYHKLKASIKIVDGGMARNPFPDENVFVNFVDGEDGFSQFLNEDDLNLIKGDYTVRAYIMKEPNQPMTIEGTTVENCADIPKSGILGVFGVKEKKCFTNNLEPVELDQVLIGGNEFEWRYDGSGDEITIYATLDKIPTNVNELGEIYSRVSDQSRVHYPEIK